MSVNFTTLSLLDQGEHEVLWAQPVHNNGQKGWKQGWVCFPLIDTLRQKTMKVGQGRSSVLVELFSKHGMVWTVDYQIHGRIVQEHYCLFDNNIN